MDESRLFGEPKYKGLRKKNTVKNLSFFKNCNKNDGFFVTKKVFFPLFSKWVNFRL